jgi:asparagine synthase (glutamine-hydrolysing)
MIPTFLVSRLVREHCTVVLGGDGGDELFGGYDHYNRLLRLEQAVRPIPRGVRRAVAATASAVLPVGFKARNWIAAIGADFSRGVPEFETYFDASTRRRLMSPRQWTPAAERIRDRRTPSGADLLSRATRMDFENYLPEDILVKVDRASMLASLEVRAPFLDHKMVEFAFSRVPSHLKATRGERKILLKKLVRRVLPPAFDVERKQGFSIPLAHWLKAGSWADLFRDVLLSQESIFDRDVVRGLLAGQRRGRNNSERLFSLALFELWRREYGATL